MNSDPSALQAVLVVIGIPIVIVVVVALLVLAPGWTRAGRYRPGDSWEHEPVLVGAGGAADMRSLVAAPAQPGELTAGAASESTEQDSTLGGISVRW